MKKTQPDARQMDWESLALPLVLMLTGLIVIIGNWLGVLSLDRIQDLWPGAVIVIGLAELMPLPGNQSQAADPFDRYRKENHRAR